MEKIALITDSTATIPQKYCQEFNITVLPQVLIWGDELYEDGVDIQPVEFYQRLKNSSINPSTSQVTPAAFRSAYERLSSDGYQILAVLISSRLSGTIDSAIQAKDMVPEAQVEIFDSFTSAMALGFQVVTAGRTIRQGAAMPDVLDLLANIRPNTGVVLTPESLEYLHRGGRIGNASRFLGTALNIKPILSVIDGRVEPVERVRTRRKAMQRLVEIVNERTAGKPVRIAAQHANDIDGAREIQEIANNQLDVIESLIEDVSPVLGTHVGPGTVAISYQMEK
ncbi:MAG: DegV family protein [Anaerolineales bacterium]